MVARAQKQKTFGRDDQLLARLAITAKQPGLSGFTVNLEGMEALKSEFDEKGRLFGVAVFCVIPQKERVRAYWALRDLDDYLTRFKLKR